MKAWAALLLGLLLADCGASKAPEAPEDRALQSAAASGRQSLEYGRMTQAMEQYRQAYKLALARNDAGAIRDAGYNLAVVELAGNDAASAQRTVLRTREAMAARGLTASAELDLVQAAALHRLGRDPEADRVAASAQATADDPAIRARASYVRGLIADARGDAAGLAAALAGFGQPKPPPPDWQADHDEIAARLSLLRGDPASAASLARQAAETRRTQLDYRAMANALALQALAMQRGGMAQAAADLYLQAGESAVSRGDKAAGARWLRQAQLPGASVATRQSAKTLLAGLGH